MLMHHLFSDLVQVALPFLPGNLYYSTKTEISFKRSMAQAGLYDQQLSGTTVRIADKT